MTRREQAAFLDWYSPVQAIVNRLGLSDAFQACAQAAQLAVTYDSRFVVANTGLLKAGKSTLFNALVGKVEHFPTGAARKTVQSQTVEVDGMLLVDTPGIDAPQEDVERAQTALRSADLVVFVHNVACGSYDATEIEQLRMLRGFFPDEQSFRTRVQPVFTLCDKYNDAEIDCVVNDSRSQIEKTLGIKLPNPLRVAAERCIKGRAEGKNLLVQRSGIPALEELLRARAAELHPRKVELHTSRMEKLRERVREALTTANREVDAELTRFNHDAETKRREWQTVRDSIINAYYR